jgi:hypothetical protein
MSKSWARFLPKKKHWRSLAVTIVTVTLPFIGEVIKAHFADSVLVALIDRVTDAFGKMGGLRALLGVVARHPMYSIVAGTCAWVCAMAVVVAVRVIRAMDRPETPATPVGLNPSNLGVAELMEREAPADAAIAAVVLRVDRSNRAFTEALAACQARLKRVGTVSQTDSQEARRLYREAYDKLAVDLGPILTSFRESVAAVEQPAQTLSDLFVRTAKWVEGPKRGKIDLSVMAARCAAIIKAVSPHVTAFERTEELVRSNIGSQTSRLDAVIDAYIAATTRYREILTKIISGAQKLIDVAASAGQSDKSRDQPRLVVERARAHEARLLTSSSGSPQFMVGRDKMVALRLWFASVQIKNNPANPSGEKGIARNVTANVVFRNSFGRVHLSVPTEWDPEKRIDPSDPMVDNFKGGGPNVWFDVGQSRSLIVVVREADVDTAYAVTHQPHAPAPFVPAPGLAVPPGAYEVTVEIRSSTSLIREDFRFSLLNHGAGQPLELTAMP